jgi:hypothetical protein
MALSGPTAGGLLIVMLEYMVLLHFAWIVRYVYSITGPVASEMLSSLSKPHRSGQDL